MADPQPAPSPDFGALFKELVWDALVKAALARLFAAIPWLGWGPVGVVVSWALTLFADRVFKELHLYVDLQIIAFRNQSLRRTWDTAAVRLKLVERDHGVDSDEFRKARDESRQALAEFIRFRVAA